MTAIATRERLSIADAAEAAVRELVSASHWGGSSFINLPMVYPDGSAVTVKLDPVKAGVRVSDNGFAYRVLEQIGAHRSFGRTAANVAEREELLVERRMIFVDVPFGALERAISDVATASWAVVDRIYSRLSDAEAVDLEEHLRERLSAIFPSRFVPEARTVVGASTVDWEVSAIVKGDHGQTIFQAVSAHPNSLHRASAAFLDLSGLDTPPHLVAVVPSKAEIGPKLNLLSQAGGYVIEEEQPDEVFRRVAA